MHIHAGTVIGGTTLCSLPYRPASIKRRMFSRRSSPKITSGAAQSSPNTKIFIGYTISKQRFSFHRQMIGNVQVVQDRGRKIDDLRVIVHHRPIHEQNAGDGIGVNNMVPAPAPVVILKQRFREPPEGTLPGNTEARAKIHQQIWSIFHERSRIDLFFSGNTADCRASGLLIGEVRESGLQRGTDFLDFAAALFQNSTALAAFHVQINSAKTERISISLGPVNRAKAVSQIFLGLLAAFQSKKIVLPQPSVGIKGATKGIEPMIGKNDQQSVFIDLFQNAAQKSIALLIQSIDVRSQARGEIRIKIGMLGVDKAPEHVLQAVRCIEYGEQETFREAAKFMHHHVFAFLEDQLALGLVGHFIEAPVVMAGMVFGHAYGGKQTNVFRESFAVIGWRGDRKKRGGRIEVHGGSVELYVGIDLPAIETHDAGHRLQHGQLEFEPDPRAPTVLRGFDGQVRSRGNDQFASAVIDSNPNLRGKVGWRISARIARTVDTSDDLRRTIEIDHLLVLFRLDGAVLGVKGTRALAPPDIRHSHSGQHLAQQVFRRKSNGATQDRTGNSCFAQILPNGHTLAPVDGSRWRQHAFGTLESIERNVRQISLRIPGNKVEDAMTARVGASHKR